MIEKCDTDSTTLGDRGSAIQSEIGSKYNTEIDEVYSGNMVQKEYREYKELYD
jgi:hypothetical protein